MVFTTQFQVFEKREIFIPELLFYEITLIPALLAGRPTLPAALLIR